MFKTTVSIGERKWTYDGIGEYNASNYEKAKKLNKVLIAIALFPGGAIDVWFLDTAESLFEVRRYYNECGHSDCIINLAQMVFAT